MITGRFFVFDTKVSNETYSVFRYNRLQKTDGQGLQQSEQCPVYVSLNDKYLGFYINHYEVGKYNHELFSFPLLNDSSSDKAIMRQLEDMSDDYYKLPKDDKTLMIVEHTEGVGFCQLWFREKPKRSDKFLYKDTLLLDFLFDFVHTDVFKSNPHWQLLNARIQTNPFLKAILAKGEWLYWRNRYQNSHEAEAAERYISEKRFDADEEWVEIIAADNSAELFLESGDWFESVGKEMNRVLYGDVRKKNLFDNAQEWVVLKFKNDDTKSWYQKALKKRQISKLIAYLVLLAALIFGSDMLHLVLSKLSSKLSNTSSGKEMLSFVGQAVILLSLLKGLKYLRKKINKENDKKLKIKERQNWLKTHFSFKNNDKSSKKQESIFNKIRVTRNRIYHFYFNRFDFDDGYIWFLRQLSSTWRFGFNWLILFSIVNLVMCLQFLDESYSVYFYFNWKRLSILLMILVLVIVIAMPMAFILRMQFAPNKNKIPSIFHPGLTLPKTSLAMLTGWLVWVPISEEAWKLNANADEGRIIAWLALMLALAIVFIFFTLKGIQPELVVGNGLTGSTIGVVLSGYAFAFGWGVLTTQFTYRQALDEPETLMPYEFGRTEESADYKRAKDSTLARAANFARITNSTKTAPAWNDSIKVFAARFSMEKDEERLKFANLFYKNKSDTNRWQVKADTLEKILEARKDAIVDTLIINHATKEQFLPSVTYWKIWTSERWWFTDGESIYIYIFPRMLLINSGIAFFLGFFAQIAFQSAGYKEPI